MRDWQPIETAPKDGRPLLLLSPEGFVGFGRMSTEVRMDAEDEWAREEACWIGQRPYERTVSFWMGGHPPSEATHWAPVLEPPAKGPTP
jgi:hypothetical protein